METFIGGVGAFWGLKKIIWQIVQPAVSATNECNSSIIIIIYI